MKKNKAAEAGQDWGRAKEHLDLYEAEYRRLPDGTGMFGLAVTILPLRRRFERGERTRALYDDIMSVE